VDDGAYTRRAGSPVRRPRAFRPAPRCVLPIARLLAVGGFVAHLPASDAVGWVRQVPWLMVLTAGVPAVTGPALGALTRRDDGERRRS
jgi:hypothetical protein